LVQRDAGGSELLVATYAFGELLVDEGAQGELPGQAGDEARAVGRVLHRVVEDQRPAPVALVRVLAGQLAAGEQLSDDAGGERGDTGAEMADALGLPAGRAPVLLGVLGAFLVVEPGPHVDAVLRRRGDASPVEEDLVRVEPAQRLAV